MTTTTPLDGTRQPPVVLDSNVFFLRPESRDFVLGKSKTSVSNNRLMMGCIGMMLSVFVLAGLGLLVMTLSDVYEWFLIMQQGVTTTGEYADRRVSTADDSNAYYVTFQYTAADTRYTTEQRVSETIYERAEVGGRVEIVYARSNPQFAAVQGTNQPPTALLVFTLVWNTFITGIIWMLVKFSRKQRYLEQNGRLVGGEIVKSSQSKDSDGDLILKVEYRFLAPRTYQRIVKTARAQRNDLRDQPLPAAGTPVIILYDSEKLFMLL